MERDAFIESLRTTHPQAFVENHLFDRVPAVFAGNRAHFISWRGKLATALEVDPNCLTIVGSAATGTSLNPNKNFKPFDDESDIDVAVISQYHFTVSWRYLRMNNPRRLSIDSRTRQAWDAHVSQYIYWGTIATDRLLGVLPFGQQWLRATTTAGSEAPLTGRDVKLRIYADYESLRSYHTKNVRELRNRVSGG